MCLEWMTWLAGPILNELKCFMVYRCWFCGDTWLSPDSGPKRQQHMCLMVAVSKDKLSTFDSCIVSREI
ncbi:hypothetical protein AB3S75_031096 [Citrus x aurantiifolia]